MFQVLLTPDNCVLLHPRIEDELDSLPMNVKTASNCEAVLEGTYFYNMYGIDCMARRIGPTEKYPRGCYAVRLRDCRYRLPYHQFRIIGKGVELLNCDRGNRFCGRCGNHLKRSDNGLSKICPACGNEVFPHVSPCVIVLVKKGNEALLVHARSFKGKHHGLVAGFVETGETVEECVMREVREETSLEIRNVRYVGSQPWAFPSNLMLAFTADYADGELCFADGEISEGGFFSRDNLPPLPTGASIARSMIEAWVRGEI